jgi:predicted ester cyclase
MTDGKAIVLRLIHDALNREDDTLVPALVHRDFFSHSAPASRASGPTGFKATIRSLHQAFAGFRLDPKDIFAEGGKVVVRATVSGRHVGLIDGSEPDGREWSAQQIHIFRIVDRQVIEHWGSDDFAAQADRRTPHRHSDYRATERSQ